MNQNTTHYLKFNDCNLYMPAPITLILKLYMHAEKADLKYKFRWIVTRLMNQKDGRE